MGRKTSDILIEKATNALISSIEIYNKPDFKYREENFAILIINAWELLFKAKILEDNNNNKKELYIKDYPLKKDGEKSKRYIFKKTRANNYLTKSIISCINILKSKGEIDEIIESNILTILEIRDNATHFYNPSSRLAQDIHEVASASVRNFIYLLNDWFERGLDHYNLYLLPLSFLGEKHINVTNLHQEETKLLDYISRKKKEHPYNENLPCNYVLYIDVTFSKKSKGIAGIKLTNDPNATPVILSTEELEKKYPLDYYTLVEKCKERYSDFTANQNFHNLRKKYFKNLRYCYPYYPNLKKAGNPKIYYSTGILEEFDKFYTKKYEK